MNIEKMSARSRVVLFNAGCVKPDGELNKSRLRELIRTDRIKKWRGAGKVTINELRKVVGLAVLPVFVHGRCYLCRFWIPNLPECQRVDAATSMGECRRFPPTMKQGVNGVTGQLVGSFVGTHPNDWCGEFKS